MSNIELAKNYYYPGLDFSKRDDIRLLSTTLRDGLQDPELPNYPKHFQKLAYINHAARLGVDIIDIATAGTPGEYFEEAVQLGKRVPPHIEIACLARTHKDDIEGAARLQGRIGRPIRTIVFVGSSPLRRWVQGWEVSQLVDWMGASTEQAAKEGLKVVPATEMTTTTEPEVTAAIFGEGLKKAGKQVAAVCIADTTGDCDPLSAMAVVEFFKNQILTGEHAGIPIEFHEHNDLGMAVANNLMALHAGASIVHGSALEVGERAGNTSMEELVMDLKKFGDARRQDISYLPTYAEYCSQMFEIPIRANHPGLGEKIRKVMSGIHADAERKARLLHLHLGSPYSAVDLRGWFRQEMEIVYGPLSGYANLQEIADKSGFTPTLPLHEFALARAQKEHRYISPEELKHWAHDMQHVITHPVTV